MRKIFLRSSLTLAAFIVLLAGPVGVRAQTAGLKKVKVAIPTISTSMIPNYVARELGGR